MTRRPNRSALAALVVGVLGLPLTATVGAGGASAAATDVFISEYVEGTSNNKAIELFNGTGSAIDLTAGAYNIQMFFNGSSSAGLTINLAGTVAAGDVFVLAQSAANPTILAQADQTNGSGWFNGDDAIVLRKGTTVLDSIGQVGVDPGTEWGTGLTSTADNTLRRKAAIDTGDAITNDPFDPAVQWDGFAVDTFGGLGAHNSTPGGGGPGGGSTCADPYTPIPAIQGTGDSAAVTGTTTTQGVVVGDYEGPSPTLRGFYLQDPVGDGDPASSDGIFVFNANNDTVALGDVVRVTGTAGEFQGQTQITATAVLDCAVDGTVAPTPVSLPFASTTAAEAFEGMLISLPQTLSVTEHFQLGRFGQVVVSSGGRLTQPTNVVAPGAAALAMQAANNLNRLIVDDALQNQNPDPILFGRGGQPLSASNTLRGGDTITGLVGVMTYTWAGNSASPNAYRIRPINALGGGVPNFVAANPRPSTVPGVGGGVQVSAMNLLNFFNTFTACTAGTTGPTTDCRGADNQAEFDRQWPKTVAAMLGTGAEVIGVIEVENDGYGPTSSMQFLVDRLNDVAGAGTYAMIDVDSATGQVDALGSDAIKVGLIYRTAAVIPIGETAVLNTVEFVNGGDSAPRNRPALAQAFFDPASGGRFVVAVNHLKSKGSACDAPDALDGQGNCAAVRTTSAQLLADWLAGDPTRTGEQDVLIVGDLNSYARETPITTLEAAGYTNLIRAFGGDAAYSYVFDGQWGYLDHVLGTASVGSQVTGVGEWHINADEPSVLDYNTNFKTPSQQTSLYSADQYRISDHDPVLVGLQLASDRAAGVKITGGGKFGPASETKINVNANYLPNGRLNGKLDVSNATIGFDSTGLTAILRTAGGAMVVASGMFNGVGDHRAIVSVTDGSPDTVEIVIRNAGGVVVYDSGAQPLSNGNLTIH